MSCCDSDFYRNPCSGCAGIASLFPTSQAGVLFVQSVGHSGELINPDAPIVFDSVREKNGIGYDMTTGQIALKNPGLHVVDLTVNYSGASGGEYMQIGVLRCDGTTIEQSFPFSGGGQITFNAVLRTTRRNVVLQLVNAGEHIMQLSNVPIQASLSVVRI